MNKTHALGFPRIGDRRQLKTLLESHWAGTLDEDGFLAGLAGLRAQRWALQAATGLDLVTVGDFSPYDHILDLQFNLGALPARFAPSNPDSLAWERYFAAARGAPGKPALEMTKWFDTNYHYLVPELAAETRWDGSGALILAEVDQALALGYQPQTIKPVLVGPATFFFLAAGSPLPSPEEVQAASAAYSRILASLAQRGILWVQIDEPILVLDLEAPWITAVRALWSALSVPGGLKLLLATYFEGAGHHRRLVEDLPVAGLHLDAVRGREGLAAFADWPSDRVLSLGVIDGRSVWKTDLGAALALLEPFRNRGEALWIATSCSLLHVPLGLGGETGLDPVLRGGLAFAGEKLAELDLLKRTLAGLDSAGEREAHDRGLAEFLAWPDRNRPGAAGPDDLPNGGRRAVPFSERKALQARRFQFPILPTTTIGSFPQTPELRRLRFQWKKGQIDEAAYRGALETEILRVITAQEALGLDLLVHGEPERNDMVEYFGEQLAGFAFTLEGWVQSYGSRCVKPPIIWGDIERRGPITVGWTAFAQGLTEKPVKGMLTGPVTILEWSFPRPDLSPRAQAFQIAGALAAEVRDLEAAGIGIIQVDEPAFREGLPLRASAQSGYWEWAAGAFRAVVAGVAPETQIHTHMCYCDFGDCLDPIASLDADVISLEASRSGMGLLSSFEGGAYLNDVGPGLWDVHSPLPPGTAEMTALLEKASAVLGPGRLWANPDCGLKTRTWAETLTGLGQLVEAARTVREGLRPRRRSR